MSVTEPGYDRIARAISDTLDAAGLAITVTERDDGCDVPLVSFARALDRAGLIDWRAFQ